MNESVVCIFNKLQTARHADSTWIPKIILNINTPQYVSSLLPLSTTSINTTDIVPFLQVPSVQLGIFLRHELNYPTHCNFCLEGYNGGVGIFRIIFGSQVELACLAVCSLLNIDVEENEEEAVKVG